MLTIARKRGYNETVYRIAFHYYILLQNEIDLLLLRKLFLL